MNWTKIKTLGASFTENHMGAAGEATALVIRKSFTAQLAGIQLGWVRSEL